MYIDILLLRQDCTKSSRAPGERSVYLTHWPIYMGRFTASSSDFPELAVGRPMEIRYRVKQMLVVESKINCTLIGGFNTWISMRKNA